jgi:hypothetical protein
MSKTSIIEIIYRRYELPDLIYKMPCCQLRNVNYLIPLYQLIKGLNYMRRFNKC